MKQVTLEQLLEAGCHFGHQVTRQNPRAREFVFEARDNIHIIDLAKTKEGLDAAASFVHDLASNNGTLVILGAKRQAGQIVKEEMKRAQEEGADGFFYVTNRWIGGIFTNFPEVLKNFRKLKDLIAKLQNKEERAKYTKKEVSLWDKERAKLESFYGGIADMVDIPDAIFVIDTHLENLAVREARKMGVATIGIVDTNADPTVIDYPIPANDDAVGSIKLIVSHIVDAWIEGRKKAKKAQSGEQSTKNNEVKSAESKTPSAKSETTKNEKTKIDSKTGVKEKRKPTKKSAKKDSTEEVQK